MKIRRWYWPAPLGIGVMTQKAFTLSLIHI